MLDFLRDIDHAIFYFINIKAAATWLDPIMILLSTRWIWTPLYILIVWLLVRRYKLRVWIVFLLLAAVVSLSDSISSRVIKKNVQRVRPNQVEKLYGVKTIEVRSPDPKDGSGKYGFVSSHAANASAIFVFAGLFLWQNWRRFMPFLIVPFLVSYSRVYLGVHYPGDVAGGALLGAFLAWLACYVYMKLPLREPISSESQT